MERIGYRFPFAMIGYKGAPAGTANLAMDKTKVRTCVQVRYMLVRSCVHGGSPLLRTADADVVH